MLRKGTYKTRSGQTVKIYGPSHWYPDKFAGHVESHPQTTYEWNADGTMTGQPDKDLIL